METGNSSTKIAIMVVANNLNVEIVRRFLWACEKSENIIPFDIVVGKHKNPDQLFYKTVILNDMIRRIINDYDVIVQTDADMLVPKGLIMDTYKYCIRSDNCYHANYYLVDPKEIKGKAYKDIPWANIHSKKVCGASGSWNGMKVSMWKQSCGFCEVVSQLGGPDSEFYLRTRKKNIRWYVTSKFPLGHINHPRRKVKKRGKKNLSIARKFPTEYNWLKNRNKEVGASKIKIYSYGEQL